VVPGVALGSPDEPSITLFENNGDGTFSQPVFTLDVANVGGGFVDLAAEDLNRDGRPDVIAATFAEEKLVVALGDTPFHLGTAEVIEIGARPTRLITHDLTGDGSVDAVVATDSGILLLAGRGDGTFLTATSIVTGDGVKDIAVLDTNGDAVADVVAVAPQRNAVLVYEGTGGGDFVTGPEFPVQQPLALAVGEFTSDTRLDVAVFGDESREVFVLEGSRSGLGFPFSISSGVLATRLISADVNGDARADLLAIDGRTGSLQTLAGAGEFPLTVVGRSGVPQTGFTVADYDGDGVDDVVRIVPLNEPELLPDPLPAAPRPCQGDCNHDRTVGTDELVAAVRLALGEGQLVCASLDRNGDAIIGIDDLIAAIDNALTECSHLAAVED
jgi:hypothetical protein